MLVFSLNSIILFFYGGRWETACMCGNGLVDSKCINKNLEIYDYNNTNAANSTYDSNERNRT